MICPNCGKAIDHRTEFCKHCGKPTNADERYNYHPSAVPIRGAGSEPGVSSDNSYTRMRDELDSLAAVVQKLPTQKQMKAAVLRYSLILALLTLFCAAICAFGIAKNHAEIDKLKEQTSRMAAQALETDLPEDTATPVITPAPTPVLTPAPTPVLTSAQVRIHFELNLPKNADLAKFSKLPEDITTVPGKGVTLSTMPDTETFQFIGWDTQADGKGTRYSAGKPFNFEMDDDLILYAQWEPIEKK